MANLNLDDLMLVDRRIYTSNVIMGVIGCGGTGSLFVRDAMRIAKVFNDKARANGNMGISRMFFCDADVVEDKNLIRQNFIATDIGRNKAEVLAERYGSAFDLDIEIIDRYIENEKDLNNIIVGSTNPYYLRGTTVLLFSMVDNVKTRLMISNYLNGYSEDNSISAGTYDLVVVDCGNSEFAGQVCISARNYAKDCFYMPTVAQLQPDLIDPANWDKFASELSCEEAAISAPQSIAANGTAANIAMNTLYNILFQGKINYNKVIFNAQNNANVTSFLRKGAQNAKCEIGRIDYNSNK